MIKNAKMIDGEKGRFKVLDKVSLQLPGPYWWHTDDIDSPEAKGCVFRAFDNEATEQMLDIASITVVDVTADPTEPDISKIGDQGVQQFDQALQDQLKSARMQLVQWMGSKLNEKNGTCALITPYIVIDQGMERQFICVRMKLDARKFVIMGCFDVAKKDTLAALIFGIIQRMQIDSSAP